MNLAQTALEARDSLNWNSSFHGFMTNFSNQLKRKIQTGNQLSPKQINKLQNSLHAAQAIQEANLAINESAKKTRTEDGDVTAYLEMQAKIFKAFAAVSKASIGKIEGLKQEVLNYADRNLEPLLALLGQAPNPNTMKRILTSDDLTNPLGLGGRFIKLMAK